MNLFFIAFLVIGVFIFLSSFFIVKQQRAAIIERFGKFHSIHIEIRDHQQIIKKGPYKYLRHPYYLSVMLELLGFPLVPNAYYTFIFSVLV